MDEAFLCKEIGQQTEGQPSQGQTMNMLKFPPKRQKTTPHSKLGSVPFTVLILHVTPLLGPYCHMPLNHFVQISDSS